MNFKLNFRKSIPIKEYLKTGLILWLKNLFRLNLTNNNSLKWSNELNTFQFEKESNSRSFAKVDLSTIKPDFDINNLNQLSKYSIKRSYQVYCFSHLIIGGNAKPFADLLKLIDTFSNNYSILIDLSLYYKDGFTSTLNEKLNLFLKEFKNYPIEYKVNLDSENYLFADDFLLSFSQEEIKGFFFGIDIEKLLNIETKDPNGLFHIRMFFDSLLRHSSIGYAERIEYKKISQLIEQQSLHKDFKIGKELDLLFLFGGISITPNIRKLASEFLSLLLAKNSKIKNEIISSGNPTQVNKPDPKSWEKVLITGWYGTETQGDKAILGEVLYFINQCNPKCKIVLTTIYNAISVQTNKELELLENVELIDIKDNKIKDVISGCDAVIMGGGPIMESSSMTYVQSIFEYGNLFQCARIVFGCGVGPIHSKRVENNARRVLELTSAGFVRDKESLEYADKLFPTHCLKYACDPAIAFVNRWRINNSQRLLAKEESNLIKVATLVRANTQEFSEVNSAKLLIKNNMDSAFKFSKVLARMKTLYDVKIWLLHMNAPWIGGDDRIFNRSLQQSDIMLSDVTNIRKYLTLEEHISLLAQMDFSIAMRYHGHVFSIALGIPFISVDYTGKSGKVASLVKRINYEECSIKWDEMNSNETEQIINKIMMDRENIKENLIIEVNKLVQQLYSVYSEVFHVTIKSN